MRSATQTCLSTVAQAEVRTTPSYTLTEVSKHCTPQDCWLIVHSRVYDVSRWVPHHPGGSLIYVRAGEDCSYLFDAYHPLSARYLPDTYKRLNHIHDLPELQLWSRMRHT